MQSSFYAHCICDVGVCQRVVIVATEVKQAANDKEQLMPMSEKLQALPKELGRAKRMLADSCDLRQSNVELCAAAKIERMFGIINSVMANRHV